MLSTDIVMVQATSFVNCEFNHFFGAWGKSDFSKNNAVSAANNKLNSVSYLVQFYPEITQYFGSNPFSLAYKPQQEVFGTDIIMLESLCFLLSKAQYFPCPLGELIKPVFVTHYSHTSLSNTRLN